MLPSSTDSFLPRITTYARQEYPMNRAVVILATLTLLFGSIERVNADFMTLRGPSGASILEGTGISGSDIGGKDESGTNVDGFLDKGSAWNTLTGPSGTGILEGTGISDIAGKVDTRTNYEGFWDKASLYTILSTPSDDIYTSTDGVINSNIGNNFNNGTSTRGIHFKGKTYTTRSGPGNTFVPGFSGGDIVKFVTGLSGSELRNYYNRTIYEGFLVNGDSTETLPGFSGATNTLAHNSSGSDSNGYFSYFFGIIDFIFDYPILLALLGIVIVCIADFVFRQRNQSVPA